MYSVEFGDIVYIFLFLPVAGLLSLVSVIFAKVAAMLVTFLGVSALLVPHWLYIRSEGRWLFNASSYKAAVMAQPVPPEGQLKHIEWDAWGGFGAGDTSLYLAYDPSDSLHCEQLT